MVILYSTHIFTMQYEIIRYISIMHVWVGTHLLYTCTIFSCENAYGNNLLAYDIHWFLISFCEKLWCSFLFPPYYVLPLYMLNSYGCMPFSFRSRMMVLLKDCCLLAVRYITLLFDNLPTMCCILTSIYFSSSVFLKCLSITLFPLTFLYIELFE